MDDKTPIIEFCCKCHNFYRVLKIMEDIMIPIYPPCFKKWFLDNGITHNLSINSRKVEYQCDPLKS